MSVADRLRAWWRDLRRGRQQGDAQTEDLDETTAALLAMLPDATVVVNRQDEVIRANPDAYTLGVVGDETIISDEVRQAVRAVRETGGCKRFDLTTHTSQRTIAATDIGALADGDDDGGSLPAVAVQGVDRPNWLKITVGKVGDFVVVLINDVSDSIRFAEVRDSFITNVSEQLLKPSRALEQLADSLANDALDAEQVSWHAHQVRSSCERLNHMVSDLMLLIKAQEPITPSSANRLVVMEQVRLACERLRAQSERFGVSVNITGDETLTVNGDAEQVDAAVAKLVQNALVYSPAGGVVNVAVTRSDDGAYAVIRVVDQGVGIAKGEQSRIFERFYRGGNQTARSRNGIGLGLSIVKHVALTHHGNVAVWSVPGSGSTFTLSLPLAR
ncbi:ATPase [Bifidobacterium aerophilum]|uniref:Sensor-like histidine kinase SenX3 n=2 Tax=Bifidobacterium aerophilum TaxID=1798155 RepID=A0A6N9Z5H8_9BIFI|nr:ATPase [Bifidobacterium aerophilum]